MRSEALAPNKIGQGKPYPNIGVFWLSLICYVLLECVSTGKCMYQFMSLGHQARGHQAVFENQLSASFRDSDLGTVIQ